ncbi:DUF2158 domain-containing protein [Phreatobacter oligotrophus]|uniref:YodC family protein n=1 Tax=Phreatobacter oligotrophus TaxID=1122261 RepID=UPI000D3C0DC8
MTRTYSVGDLVRLKSGGPTMTVERVDDDGMVQCLWFPTPGKPPSSRSFSFGVLEPATGKGVRPNAIRFR